MIQLSTRFQWWLAVLAPVLATVIAVSLDTMLPSADMSIVYLAGVLLTAMRTRVRPALLCAVLSFLSFNYFIAHPRYSFQVVQHEDILTVTLLVMVAVVTGHLAARLNEKVIALELSDRWNHQQIDLSRALAICTSASDVVDTLASELKRCYGVAAKVMPELAEGDDKCSGSDEPEDGVRLFLLPDAVEIRFCWQGRTEARIGYRINEPLTTEQRHHLAGFSQLASLAWCRVQAERLLQQETLIKEREQLRSALLSSISHDLRTPLSTMIGSVSSLIELDSALTGADREELLKNTLSEAQRLNRYIQKLLDMTRLGHGEMTLDRDWVGIDDITSVVVKRARPLLGETTLRLEIPDELPLLHVHPALIEQALFNVLENAIRFTPPGSEILLAAGVDQEQLWIDVSDQGPGIPHDQWETIFDMFATFGRGDQYPAGTGLGLAICQGILGAHGGSVKVIKSGPGQGTTIRLSMPLPNNEQEDDNA